MANDAPTYGELWPKTAKQWDEMVINKGREEEFKKYALAAISHKTIYQDIERETSVLWYITAVIHLRESNSNFSTYLGNGQSLSKKTTIKPFDRGPFTGQRAFQDGAKDALHIDGLDVVQDWRLEKILYYLQKYNGFGYEMYHNLPSPYIWGGTNIQKLGKYGGYVDGKFVDNRFFPDKMDTQPGCAPVLAMIAKLDPSVKFIRETPMGVEPPAAKPTPQPSKPDEEDAGFWGWLKGKFGG